MVPSFITWKSTSRSMVSNRKAVRVISFSGSSSNGCAHARSAFKPHDVDSPPYLAFQKGSDLVLNTLRLTQ